MINIHDVVEPMPNSNSTLVGKNRFLATDPDNNAFLIRVDNGVESHIKRVNTPPVFLH